MRIAIAEDGFLYITGRKEELITTASGKNVAPIEIENALRRQPGVAQAVVYGDRRPYICALVAPDADALADTGADPQALIAQAVNTVNGQLSRAAQIKRFTLLPRELSQDTGELTPTLKVKRAVVYDRYADLIDGLYRGA